MMKTIIYENVIKKIGPNVEAFGGEMMILFGENAPDTLKDFCYTIKIEPIKALLCSGQKLKIDNSCYEILHVGEVAEKNLVDLGHLTIVFSGESDEILPGSIVVEKKESPSIKVGSKISILS